MEVAAVAEQLQGPRAPNAWAALARHARLLAGRSDAPTQEVLALRPYLMHSFDASADALLARTLATASESGAPEEAELQLLVATRAVQRGELARAAAKGRVARALGAPAFGLDMLEAHIAIRTGALSRARERVEEHARVDPRMRLQHAFFLLASGRHEDAAALLRRAAASEVPLMRAAAHFFLAESATRRGAWEESCSTASAPAKPSRSWASRPTTWPSRTGPLAPFAICNARTWPRPALAGPTRRRSAQASASRWPRRSSSSCSSAATGDEDSTSSRRSGRL